MKVQIEIDVTDELIEQIKSDNDSYDLSTEEVVEGLEEFKEEVEGRIGLLLNNLDYFNN